ncbi:hypothetical protein [Actinomadura rupiterrae]|uniref:hypothetical protein n=1 Tax=Actinomadura rupiterrae TaxID=559627 RepID=UPI0020A47D10|nr:hypothetical protein [Actinomadura rupiterrae]MCP2339237.1 hypothetical protein [Actinomadura rupiterrae]
MSPHDQTAHGQDPNSGQPPYDHPHPDPMTQLGVKLHIAVVVTVLAVLLALTVLALSGGEDPWLTVALACFLGAAVGGAYAGTLDATRSVLCLATRQHADTLRLLGTTREAIESLLDRVELLEDRQRSTAGKLADVLSDQLRQRRTG